MTNPRSIKNFFLEIGVELSAEEISVLSKSNELDGIHFSYVSSSSPLRSSRYPGFTAELCEKITKAIDTLKRGMHHQIFPFNYILKRC
jgi:hypothetical protein